MPITHKTPSSAGKVGAAQWDEVHAIDGPLSLPSMAVAPPASVDALQLFASTTVGTAMAACRDAFGATNRLQPSLAFAPVSLWYPIGAGSTGTNVVGCGPAVTLGASTGRALASGSFFSRMRRIGQTTAATAGSTAGYYWAANTGVHAYTLGSDGVGGFFFSWCFGLSGSVDVPGSRMFVGLSTMATAPSNVEPSTLTHCVGIAKLSTKSTLHVVYGGSQAQAAIDLGPGFPADTRNTDMYRLLMFSPPVGGEIYVQVERMTTGNAPSSRSAVVKLSGAAGVVVPSAAGFMAPRAWLCNNTQALAAAFDLGPLYLQGLGE